MSKQTVTHEIKLQPSVILIFAVLALGIFGLAFGPSGFGVGDADANHNGSAFAQATGTHQHPFVVHIQNLQ